MESMAPADVVRMVKMVGTISEDQPEPFPVMECAGLIYNGGTEAEKAAALEVLLPLAFAVHERTATATRV